MANVFNASAHHYIHGFDITECKQALHEQVESMGEGWSIVRFTHRVINDALGIYEVTSHCVFKPIK
ncbi:hypothetical protein [Vibrio splendidus]|uniref:hypothetical protein n=1 Tax=Vibrio splendidus TaxID=29497 RepID=UPI000D339AAA|nr:hypothetical protein [Vibrio splendidus]PTP95471.1 hypothetical protein CWO02_01110 [Vibrio splendidus]